MITINIYKNLCTQKKDELWQPKTANKETEGLC